MTAQASQESEHTVGDVLHHLQHGEPDTIAALVLQHIISQHLPISRETPLKTLELIQMQATWPFLFTEDDDPIRRIQRASVDRAFNKLQQLKDNPHRIVRRQ